MPPGSSTPVLTLPSLSSAKTRTRSSQATCRRLSTAPRDKRDLALLQAPARADVPVVAVFLSGRPLWVNAEINAADSFVAAWLPGPEGGGIADVLFRAADGSVRYDFRGSLPFSWPALAAPPAVGDGLPGEPPLFALGYGPTYADDGYLRQLPQPEERGDGTAARPGRVAAEAARPPPRPGRSSRPSRR